MEMKLSVMVYDGCDNGCQGILWSVESECAEVLCSNFAEDSLKKLGVAIKATESGSYPYEYGLVLSIHHDQFHTTDINLGTINHEGKVDPCGVIVSNKDVYEGIGRREWV